MSKEWDDGWMDLCPQGGLEPDEARRIYAIIEAAVALVRQWKSDDCLTYYQLESVLEHAVEAYEKEKG